MTYAAQKLKTGSSRTASTDGRDGDDDGEEHHRFEVAQMQRRGREVTERGAECEGRDDRCPIEQLATRRRDAVDRERVLHPIHAKNTATKTMA